MLHRNQAILLIILETIGASPVLTTLVRIFHLTFAQGQALATSRSSVTPKDITDPQPVIGDPDLKVETIFKGDKFPPEDKGPAVINPGKGLVDFGGKGKYRTPELTWNLPVGLTALKFLNSDKLGKQY